MDLRRLVPHIRTWLPLMLIAAVVGGAVAFVVSSAQSKVFEARATLVVGQALSATNPDYTQLLVAQNLTETYAAIAKTRPNLEAVIDSIGLEVTPEDLAERIEIEAPSSSTLLSITAQDSTPTRAAAIANELAGQLIAITPAIQGGEAEFQKSIDEDLAATQALIGSTQRRVDELTAMTDRTAEDDAELTALEGRLASLRSTAATLLTFTSGRATNLLTIIDPAAPPTEPVLPRVLLNTLIAAMFGLLAVAVVAFVAEQLDDSIRTAEAVSEVAGLNTLGSIATIKAPRGGAELYQLTTLLYPQGTTTEAYRILRANLEFAAVDAPLASLLVASAVSGEGKTVTAANLAVVFAQTGRSVLLVDADLRKPSIHTLFRLPNKQGLTSMLRSPVIDVATVAQPTEQPGLKVLTTGPLPPNPAELLGSRQMQAVLDRLKESADLVVFDSAPINAVTDAAVLSTRVDAAILVVDASRSRRRAVKLAGEALSRAGASVLGAVLNRVPAKHGPGYMPYYGAADEAAGSIPGSPAVLPSEAATPSGGTPGWSGRALNRH